jgi:hypothetical protein
VTNLAQVDLNRLFVELRQWRKVKADIFDMASCDRLALTCLKITSLLVGNQRLQKIIATHLSLLFHSKKELSFEEHLKKSFLIMDDNLEENLRGFSNLLTWVLDDHIIRRDPCAMLRQVPKVEMKISNNFSQLSFALFAYCDLEDAFLLQMPKIPVVLFLRALTKVYDVILNNPKKIGKQAVAYWLKERIKNDELRSLYMASFSGSDLKKVSEATIDHTKELLVLLLCLKVARSESLKVDEVALLNTALNSLGMLGLGPLISSGFLFLEEENNKKKDVIKKTATKIVRIK